MNITDSTTTNAQQVVTATSDMRTRTQIDTTRARALIKDGHYLQAVRSLRNIVGTLSRRDNNGLLVEALTLRGIAMARLGNFSNARAQLNRAIEVAQQRSDIDGQCEARLTIIRELFAQTSTPDILAQYELVLELLGDFVSETPTITHYLIDTFQAIVEKSQSAAAQIGPATPETWEGFSLKKDVLAHEAVIIQRALQDAGGSVTLASRLLGFRHHQSLISILNSRHRQLLSSRSAARKRRHHIIASSKPKRRSKAVAATN